MDEIEELIASYAKALPDRARELETALKGVFDDLASGASPDWERLEYVAHKLAGSSGTYGFIHLSVALRHLEEAVADKRLARLSPARAREHLERCWQVISEQLAAACRRQQPLAQPDLVIAGLVSHLEALLRQEAA